MTHLSEVQFDCLDAVATNGALCVNHDGGLFTNPMFVALASPRVSPNHPGWEVAVINALDLMGLLQKTGTGEYTISHRGKKAWSEYRAAMAQRATAAAVRANPGKVILMRDFRK